ncbi:hybrid sensor histidine kinase/response regulator [Pseudotabrizicola formosa]|uniref:hybrid sensor histidine kinase/response regulator n=1 Tax=Pseudotabrizicola formosa TaxID=2030009 RepID=UPI001FEEF345|nr:ATP-binding protein [Pseudotabrizicola formosa]
MLPPAAGRARVYLWLNFLAGAAVFFMAVWVVFFLRLLAAEREITTRVREDAMWAVFQADRHAAALLHILREGVMQGNSAGYHDLMVAYDVLYSRAKLLERGAFAIDLSGQTALGQLSIARTAEVTSLAPEFDRLSPASRDYLLDLKRLEPRIAALRDGMGQLVLAANAAVSEGRVAERATRKAIHDGLGLSAAFLVVAFFGIATLLLVHMRFLRRAHARLALLQRRSLRQANRAKAANATKSIFLATMSHEIRTPLNAIIGSAELLGSDGLDTTQCQRVQTIQSAGQLLQDVISDILDYSKLESRGLDLQLVPVDLSDVARTIASTFEERAAAKSLRLTIAFEPCRIRTDPRRLRQVLVNLVGNALKFTPSGEVRATAAMRAPDRLRVEVIDTGIGIRPEDQARLFQDFEQIDGSYARAYGGTGLGLAICKRIATGMGGEIGVISAQGNGSTFWFEFPVEPLTDLLPAAALSEHPAQGALDILVVEDNPVNRAVIADQLVQLGHRPSMAQDGFVALDRLAAERFDLVLMDMQMPGISGPDTVKRLRAGGCALPIIGVTANATREDRKACEDAGMNGFLAKPVTLGALSAAICDTLSGAALRPQTTVFTPETPHAPSNPQLDDLLASLGASRVIGLLDQFECTLAQTLADLHHALELQSDSALDAALHSLKGAALTLGLVQTAEQAEALRPPGHAASGAVDALMSLAQSEITRVQAGLRRVTAVGSSPIETV